MSIYRDTNAAVVFEHPFEGSLTATVYRNGVKLLESTPITSQAGRFTLNLTYRETQFDGELKIVWSGDDGGFPFERVQHVEVCSPIVPISRLRTLFTNTNWGDAELAELEQNIRLVIQAHTGQSFGFEVGSKYVTGTGEKKISLPQRLNRLYTVTGGPVTYFAVSADGWSLNVAWKNYMGIKEMPPEDYVENVTIVSGVIHVPDSYWKKFHRGTTYAIEGEWGYPNVPTDVQEAALLLANDFGSGENLYRDRYLEAIKSGDWNLVFSEGAFRGTGNARADGLLQKYRREGMVII